MFSPLLHSLFEWALKTIVLESLSSKKYVLFFYHDYYARQETDASRGNIMARDIPQGESA